MKVQFRMIMSNILMRPHKKWQLTLKRFYSLAAAWFIPLLGFTVYKGNANHKEIKATAFCDASVEIARFFKIIVLDNISFQMNAQ